MNPRIGESWRFQVSCSHADGVYLVTHENRAGKTWRPMNNVARDLWCLDVALTPGRYRMAYYMREGETYILGGTFGLSADRLSGPDPNVHIEPMEQPATT